MQHESRALGHGLQPSRDVLRFPKFRLIGLQWRLGSWCGLVMIRIRVFVVIGDGCTNSNVRRLLRHGVKMLRMSRIPLALRIRWMMQVIRMIAIHGPNGGSLREP